VGTAKATNPSEQLDPLRVVYIMGAGRSGSTVLAALLGNHPAMENAGELSQLARLGWINGEYCACAQPGNQCPFWCGVRREWQRRIGGDDLEGYVARQRRFEHSRGCLLRLARQQRRPRPDYQLHLHQTRALLDAIGEVSGRPVIIDSSKWPSRALVLSRTPGVDLRIIYLVRDCRGVAWSQMKSIEKDAKAGMPRANVPCPAWRSALEWIRVDFRVRFVLRYMPEVPLLRVRYEDFVARPQETLEDIGKICGLDLRPVGKAFAAGEPMGVGHAIAGNRLRMAGSVRLKPDTEWLARMSPADRWICWSLSGWRMRQYGYSKSPA